MFGVILDGKTYDLNVKYGTIGRSFRIEEGENSGTMLSGLYTRDIIGTYYDYVMEVESDPRRPAVYDQFFEAISAPADSHQLILPYGQGTITFNAMVSSGSDNFYGKLSNVSRWGGLRVNFRAIRPKREPT